ncbi:MAG: amidase [Acidimicrobiales bacterium]|jgi:amidase
MDELAWMDAHDQAELVRSGELSAAELVEAAIGRIDKLNPVLNAVIHPRFDKARREAARLVPDGPFCGVPLVLKDLACQSVGDPYHCGTRFLKDAGWHADHDTGFVKRFRDAGFVIVGRTNVPEFGLTITTEPVAYGPTRNPWNTGISTGGSSGGSAAAVAAGMVPVAHGNDGGGSIRIPASECGLVGLKPTRARVSQAPDMGEAWMGSTVQGVLTRTVRDTAAILDCIAGDEPGDPYPAPPLPRCLALEVGADPGRLRVGFLDHPLLGGLPSDPDGRQAVSLAVAMLAELGHSVEESHPRALEEEALQVHFLNVVAAGTARDLAAWEERLGRKIADDEVETINSGFAAAGRALGAADYLGSMEWLHGYSRRVSSFWADDGFDVLVTPVLNGAPPPIGWLGDPTEGLFRTIGMLQYTAQFNVTGQPAVSLPLHWTSDGLPVGVQFVAGYGREDLLVRLASQIESAAPWCDRRPELSDLD